MMTRKYFFIGVLALLAATGLAGRTNRLSAEPPENLDEIIGRVQEFQSEVEQIRGKKFKTDVTVRIQSSEDFRKYVRQAIDTALPESIAEPCQTALIKLGLLPEGYNLRQSYEELYVSQAAAYYDPTTKSFYVLKTKLPPQLINPYFVHELTHALQDQYFDLASLHKKTIDTGNDDQAIALTYLVEGEATYLMTIYSLQSMGMDSPELLQQSLALQNQMDYQGQMDLNRMTLGMMDADTAAEMKESLDVLEKTPLYLFWVLHAPYLQGAYSIHRVVKKNEWAGVDKLFANPPTTTEQVLHPDKLEPNRDEPTPCALPPALGEDSRWSVAYQNTLGEFGFWVLCEKFKTESVNSKPASSGWDGDRYFLLKNNDSGHYALTLLTAWDSEADARQSFKAYSEILAKKYPAQAGWTTDKNEGMLTLSRTTAAGRFMTALILKNKSWAALEDFPQAEMEKAKNAVLENLTPEVK